MTHTTRAKRFNRAAAYIAKQGPRRFTVGQCFAGPLHDISGHIATMLGWKPLNDYSFDGTARRRCREDHADDIAREFLGLGEDAVSLFSADAPWDTSVKAVAELKRRAQKAQNWGYCIW
ncbi:MAG: hypothetical protein KGL39_13810 [Patescibacteria group bacterium]|nr:hypothetical protein [Patescibacteria group bacterium]